MIGPSASLVVSDWYSGTPPYRVSALQGIRNSLGSDTNILFATSNKADSAVIAARDADVAIVCVGNHPLSYGLGWGQNLVASDGREDVDRQALSLEQEDLVKLVYAVNRNTVLVIVSSFPYTVNWSVKNIPAIVHISQSSQELGNGLADVLFGEVSPAGRLVQTWPSSIDQLPPILEYNIRKGRTYMYSKAEPLFAFGYGLGYTSFAFDRVRLDRAEIEVGESTRLFVDVTNTGARAGDEVVQLYIRDVVSSVTRPVKELKGFERVSLAPGERRTVAFDVTPDRLAFYDIDMVFRVEPGEFRLMIGSSSRDQDLQAVTLRVRGPRPRLP